eukprot:53040_1
MSFTARSRHDTIMDYLNKINKTTTVFESNTKWRNGMLLNNALLESTSIPTFKKHGWTDIQINTLFTLARCRKKVSSRTPNKTNSTKKKTKSSRHKKCKSDADLHLSKLSRLMTPQKPRSKTTKQSKAKGLRQAKSVNPYLDPSVFANDDTVTKRITKTKSQQSHASTDCYRESLSPSSAKRMLEQIPWENINDYGMTMECNFVIRRDKDTVIDQLKEDNKRLLEQIKCFEDDAKQETNHSSNNCANNEIKRRFEGFEDGFVILRSECNHRPLVQNDGLLVTSDAFVGFEVFTKWKMIESNGDDGRSVYQFQVSNATDKNKYIRVTDSASTYGVDARGNGTSQCEFIAHLVPHRNVILFESATFRNAYLAVNKDGMVYVYQSDLADDGISNECMFQVLMEHHNIILHIKKPDNMILTIHVDIKEHVSTVKRIIYDKENIAIKEQQLYMDETELNDNEFLNKYVPSTLDVVELTLVLQETIKEEKDENEDTSSSDDYNAISDDDIVCSSSSSSDADIQSDDDDDQKTSAIIQHDDDDVKETVHVTHKTSVFKCTTNDTDVHSGGISSICVSPIDYKVVTGGEHDRSLRIWEPKRVQKKKDGKLLSEIQFVPKQKAQVNGTVFSVTMSADGVLIAAGCSWRKSQNGYVVIWNMKNNGNILCDLRSKDDLKDARSHRTRHTKSVSSGVESVKKISKSNIFKIKQTDSVSSLRFGVVHCVTFMRFKSKKNRLNYILFAGDTTGCVLCWNLSLKRNKEIPICRINAGNDVIYDLEIKHNKYLFVVSQDKSMRYCNISGFEKKRPSEDEHAFESIDTMQIYRDQEYPLLSIAFNSHCNELIFGSRKCVQFELNQMVVIRHAFQKYLCLDQQRQLNGNGLDIKRKSHKWNIEYLPKERIRLRSRKSGKYLRIKQNGTVDVDGDGQQTEFESILIWKASEKTLQSHKHRQYYVGVCADNNAIVCVNKNNKKHKISIEFDLFDADKLEPFESFFKCIDEPPQDLDLVKSLKIRNKLLMVQRKDKKNQIKLFSLSDGNGLFRTYKITQCQYQDEKDKMRNCHIFRVYDSGISFNEKYVILCVGIFDPHNLKKAVAFSLRGFKIAKSKKVKMCSFCPKM